MTPTEPQRIKFRTNRPPAATPAERIKVMRSRFSRPDEWLPMIDVISANEFEEVISFLEAAEERERVAIEVIDKLRKYLIRNPIGKDNPNGFRLSHNYGDTLSDDESIPIYIHPYDVDGETLDLILPATPNDNN